MARIKYNPFRRDFIVAVAGMSALSNPCSEFYLQNIGDADVNTAIEQAKATPDNWVEITPHKSYTLRAYR
jgi:hypothetical protein